MLLKTFLDEENLTLDEAIEKFGVHKGVNDAEGYHMNYSDALNTEQFGLKRSKKIQSLLFYEFISRLPAKRGRGKICFSYKVEKLDVNYTRTLIRLLVEKGY